MIANIVNFFISAANAQTVGNVQTTPQGNSFSFFVMIGVFFLFLYFAVWRPQSKRAKEMQNLLSSLAKGDEVVTAGGILARITKLTDQYAVLSLGNNVEIVIQKSSIVGVLPKGTLKSVE